MASELPRLLDTASKFSLFSASGLKDDKIDKKSKPTWKLKHTNSILESFKYFCQISSKLILTILSYTVSNLVHFLRHNVVRYIMHETWSVVSQEKHRNCCQEMSHFKAKMHQIRFRLGLRPRPRWGSLQRSPRPPTWI